MEVNLKNHDTTIVVKTVKLNIKVVDQNTKKLGPFKATLYIQNIGKDEKQLDSLNTVKFSFYETNTVTYIVITQAKPDTEPLLDVSWSSNGIHDDENIIFVLK